MRLLLVAAVFLGLTGSLCGQTASSVKLQTQVAVDKNNSPILLTATKNADGTFTLNVNSASTGVSATRTIAISTVSTSGSVAAGKHYIEFALSSDFTGTIGGVSYTGAATAIKGFPYLPNDTYAALAYTVTAGSAILTAF